MSFEIIRKIGVEIIDADNRLSVYFQPGDDANSIERRLKALIKGIANGDEIRALEILFDEYAEFAETY